MNASLSALDFLRRFVQHVLPRRFVKVRHYGLLANRQRQEKLAIADASSAFPPSPC